MSITPRTRCLPHSFRFILSRLVLVAACLATTDFALGRRITDVTTKVIAAVKDESLSYSCHQ